MATVKNNEDLTKEDKIRIYNAGIVEFEKANGKGLWHIVEEKMTDFLDRAFDKVSFSKMTGDERIEAVMLRNDFGRERPTLPEYSAWMMRYETHIEEFEVPEE